MQVRRFMTTEGSTLRYPASYDLSGDWRERSA